MTLWWNYKGATSLLLSHHRPSPCTSHGEGPRSVFRPSESASAEANEASRRLNSGNVLMTSWLRLCSSMSEGQTLELKENPLQTDACTLCQKRQNTHAGTHACTQRPEWVTQQPAAMSCGQTDGRRRVWPTALSDCLFTFDLYLNYYYIDCCH